MYIFMKMLIYIIMSIYLITKYILFSDAINNNKYKYNREITSLLSFLKYYY